VSGEGLVKGLVTIITIPKYLDNGDWQIRSVLRCFLRAVLSHVSVSIVITVGFDELREFMI